MSITKITLLMISLLFHACNARSLGVLYKDEEKQNLGRVFTPSDVKVKTSAEPNNPMESEKDHHQELKDSSTSNYGVSVSWRVHHKKKEDPPPEEFNLDYLPARTHPPVHN